MRNALSYNIAGCMRNLKMFYKQGNGFKEKLLPFSFYAIMSRFSCYEEN